MGRVKRLNYKKLIKSLNEVRLMEITLPMQYMVSTEKVNIPGVHTPLINALSFSTNAGSHPFLNTYYGGAYDVYAIGFTPLPSWGSQTDKYRAFYGDYVPIEIYVQLEKEYPTLIYKIEAWKTSDWVLEGPWVDELISFTDALAVELKEVKGYLRKKAKSDRLTWKQRKEEERNYRKEKAEKLALAISRAREEQGIER